MLNGTRESPGESGREEPVEPKPDWFPLVRPGPSYLSVPVGLSAELGVASFSGGVGKVGWLRVRCATQK